MAFCIKCGTNIPDEKLLCDDCEAKEAEATASEPVSEAECEASEGAVILPVNNSCAAHDSGESEMAQDRGNEGESLNSEQTEPEYIEGGAIVEGSGEAKKRKKKILLIAGISAVAVVVIAIAVLFMTRILCIHDWMEATCEHPMTCSRCEREKGEANGHEWGVPDCLNPKTCSVCDAEICVSLGHDWTAASCLEAKTCARCGEVTGEALGHDWEEANCLAPKTCIRCNEATGEKGGHDWKAATCTSAKKCSACGKTSGKSKGHTWQAATCTNAKTCKTCKTTSGSAKGHTWRKATCQSPKTCTTCGKTSGSIGGHTWQNATITSPKQCTTCGMTSGTRLNYSSLGTGYVDVDEGSTLLLRDSMSNSAETLASIPDNAAITIWDCNSSGWYYSTYEGKYGYVKSAYVTFSKPSDNNNNSNSTYPNTRDGRIEFINDLNDILETTYSEDDDILFAAYLCGDLETVYVLAVTDDLATIYNNLSSYRNLYDTLIENMDGMESTFEDAAADCGLYFNFIMCGVDGYEFTMEQEDSVLENMFDNQPYSSWAEGMGVYVAIDDGYYVYQR